MRHFVLIAIVFLFVGLGYGQATRTWVSGVGDDVNPCSRTAPCKTFAGAISKTATNGEINCLDPAGYGAVTITKSITIDCRDTQGSILSAGTNGIIINITSEADVKKAVKLSGISINGAGTGLNGIRLVAAKMLNVEDLVIDGCTQHGISIEGGSQVTVNNSTIRSNKGSGISGSAGDALVEIMSLNSLIAGNGVGIFAGLGTTIKLSNNSMVFNTTGLSGQGKILSFKNNVIDGNTTNGSPTSAIALQ